VIAVAKKRERRTLHSLDDVPATFPDEEAEARFWDTHELGPELLAGLARPADPRLPPVRKMRAGRPKEVRAVVTSVRRGQSSSTADGRVAREPVPDGITARSDITRDTSRSPRRSR